MHPLWRSRTLINSSGGLSVWSGLVQPNRRKGPTGGLTADSTSMTRVKAEIFSVKAGKVTVSHIRDLVGVLTREKAEIGAFLSLEPPTSPMRREAASAGFYESPWGKHPRIQLLTIEDLLGGKSIDYPQAGDVTFKRRSGCDTITSEQKTLPMEGEEGR